MRRIPVPPMRAGAADLDAGRAGPPARLLAGRVNGDEESLNTLVP
ncbi:hypothetical protein Plo01_39730 [Planobispora longispora]|uniref:Uncharacterized protein n=1 Tax=Planobispora longispora TaxID=28887 RepID=A0A8J3RPY9_9ACTN|nr:hypothetical protein Plo01_39730 [Planobispora longispora]